MNFQKNRGSFKMLNIDMYVKLVTNERVSVCTSVECDFTIRPDEVKARTDW